MNDSIGIKEVYESQAQCSAATGIPKEVIKTAMKEGCAGFTGSRVRLEPLLRWIFKEGQDLDAIKTNWNEVLKKSQALREQIKLSKDRHEVVARDDVVFAIGKASSLLWSIRERLDTLELPAALKGLQEAGIQARLVAASGEQKKTFEAVLKELESEKPKDQQSESEI